MPLISIITPTFNIARSLPRCLSSISCQTFQDFELLIQDGGSSDGTKELAIQAHAADARFLFFEEADHGVYDAMNKAIRKSSGEWLLFLGGDDHLTTPDTFSNISPSLMTTEADIVYGDVYFKSDRRYDGPFDMEKILTRNLCHQAMFFRRSVFESEGYYDLNYRTEADYAFNLKCWLGGSVKTQYIPEVIAWHEAGGLTSQGEDFQMKEDYPRIVPAMILGGKMSRQKKINALAIAYRKIAQRYSWGVVLKTVFGTPSFFARLLAFVWLGLTLPYYLLKRLFVKTG